MSAPSKPKKWKKTERPSAGHSEQPIPDVRQMLRLLYANRIWLFSTVLLAISCAIGSHIFETRSFVSQVVLSYSSSKISPLSGVAGFENSDDFLPKMNALVEESRSIESCKSLVAEVRNKHLDKAGVRTKIDEASVCDFKVVPDLDKMQVVVSVHSLHPALSQATANAAAIALVKTDENHISRKVRALKGFLADQESQLGTQLKTLEDERTRFQAESSVISVPQAEKTIYDGLEKSEQEYFEYEVKLKANESLIRQTEDSIREITKGLTSSENLTSNLYLTQIQYRLTMLRYRRSMLGSVETTESKAIDTEIASILQTYRQVLQEGNNLQFSGDPLEYLQTLQASVKSLKKDNSQLKNQIASLEKNLKKKSGQISTLAGNIQRLGELSREIEVTNSLYLAIKKRLQEVDIEMAATVSDLSILRQASLGYPENSPLSRKILFALAIGLFLNIAFLLGRDMFIPTVKDVAELEAMGIPAVGYVPLVQVSPLVDVPVLLRELPDSTDADAFRALRLRLMSISLTLKKANKAVVILVTSPLPETGKSFVSSNLAYATAKSGIKTLLVDLDLRRPSVAKFYPIPEKEKGLDRFFDRNQVSDCVVPVIANLDVIHCNEPASAPAEKLEQLFLEKFIDLASSEYDLIILDSPPVLTVIDPFLVAPHADLNLLVVEYRKTHKDDILNSVRQLSALQDIPTYGLINCVLPEMISGDGAYGYYRVISTTEKSNKIA